MSGRVINVATGQPFDVYIGRPSIWANPYSHKPSLYPGVVRVATRMEAIERHEAWLMTQKHLLDRLFELCGKVLGCHCSPLKCHGDTLVRLANPTETSDLSALMTALLDPEHG